MNQKRKSETHDNSPFNWDSSYLKKDPCSNGEELQSVKSQASQDRVQGRHYCPGTIDQCICTRRQDTRTDKCTYPCDTIMNSSLEKPAFTTKGTCACSCLEI
ncbi:hypothetical protein HELRODRAFT_162168 [Helobdella robusta]|uniref:Uncharacterized protein n=1 Tax=Helobdella robusta TaxID=6412 RepID=T1ESB3_HELRO|nr:hypothetical protein HELRODRAFT_162168 [Helobdella robusta]ESN98718.1 hypothetical protein HELRODRAFT_162168 [Helobdella robusta]